MSTATREREISLAEAARLLGLSWAQVYRLVLMRQLDARQDHRNHWKVTAASLRRYQTRRDRSGASGRRDDQRTGDTR